MTKTKRLASVVAATMIAAVSALAPAAPAAAAYDEVSCYGRGTIILCNTPYIQPHSTQGWLRLTASGSGCIVTWKIVRQSDKAVVRQGSSTTGNVPWRTEYGFSAAQRYRLEVRCGASQHSGRLSNFT